MILYITLLGFFFFMVWYFHIPRKNLFGKHVLISGGSSGIGLSIAKKVISSGANVTLIARDEKKLKNAVDKIKESEKSNVYSGKIQHFSADVSASKSTLADIVNRSEEHFGPVYMLVNCAGFAKAGVFEDIPEKDARDMMNVNCMGSFFLTQEVVKRMKDTNTKGIITFVSSQGGLLGIFGYTAYAASKAALIKLSESLHMELKPHGISVTVYCPPDTDTPGLAEENQTKPAETMAISASSGLYKPEEIAADLIDASVNGKFLGSPGLEGFLLITLYSGMSPITSASSLILQIFLFPLARIIAVFFQLSHDRIVQKEYEKRLLKDKAE